MVKDTFIGIADVFVYNYITPREGWGSSYVSPISKTEFENEIKNPKVHIDSNLDTSSALSGGRYYFGNSRTPYKKIIYGTYEYPLEDLTVECEYISRTGLVSPKMKIVESHIIDSTKTSKYWCLKDENDNYGLDVDSVAGLKIKIKISDDLGNYEEKECQFPSIVDTDNIKKIEVSGSTTKVYFNSSVPLSSYLNFTTDNSQCYLNGGLTDKYVTFNSDYNKDVSLSYTGTDFKYLLFGPVHTIAINDSVAGENNTEQDENVLNLLQPTVTYTKGELSSGSVIITMQFDSQVWDYWDEIQFTDMYSGHSSYEWDKHLITKGETTFTFLEDRAISYKSNPKLTLKAFKLSGIEKDANGKITKIISRSGQKVINLPSLPEECYTFAPSVEKYDYYNIENGKPVYNPIRLTLAYPTQEIKHVIYWEQYGTRHVDNYIKKEGSGASTSSYMKFYYPLENFFENGDITIVVEDQKGNTSDPIVIRQYKMPYVSKILSDEKVQLSEKLDTQVTTTYRVHFSSFTDAGWASSNSFEAKKTGWTETLTNPNGAIYGKIPEKTFVRFYISATYSYSPERCLSQFSYLYYDSQDSASHIGYILDDNRGISVFSERPAFVYTVSSKKPYKECVQWDISDWESCFHKVSNEMVMDLQSQTKRYQVDLSKLEPGDNYVVIAHFVDGHTDMSAVRQYE